MKGFSFCKSKELETFCSEVEMLLIRPELKFKAVVETGSSRKAREFLQNKTLFSIT